MADALALDGAVDVSTLIESDEPVASGSDDLSVLLSHLLVSSISVQAEEASQNHSVEALSRTLFFFTGADAPTTPRFVAIRTRSVHTDRSARRGSAPPSACARACDSESRTRVLSIAPRAPPSRSVRRLVRLFGTPTGHQPFLSP